MPPTGREGDKPARQGNLAANSRGMDQAGAERRTERQKSDRSVALTSLWSGTARGSGRSPGRSPKGYLPSVSSFFFPSSFIFLTVGLWLLSPVVWVVVAGGAALGTEGCSGPVFAGRAAVVPGELACAAVVGVVAGVCSPPDFGMTV